MTASVTIASLSGMCPLCEGRRVVGVQDLRSGFGYKWPCPHCEPQFGLPPMPIVHLPMRDETPPEGVMTDKPTVVEAMAAVMEDVRAVRKGSRNQDQGYSFRGIDAVVNAVGPALRKHGVVVMPVCEEANYRDVRTSRDKPARECTVRVRYRFYGPAGDAIECVTPGESMDFSDKGAPKAMSVAYRIALLQALCLPTDDTDADSHNYERAADEGRTHGANGSGEPPPDTASAARAVLATRAKARNVSLDVVAAAYQRINSRDLATETDPAYVRQFIARLDADPDGVLGEAVPAP